jgi:acyl carrier protein
MSQVRAEEVRAFILEQLAEPLRALGLSPDQVPDDFDLHESGVIDSFGLLELIAAIEDRFELEIDFEALDPEQLTVIAPLTQFIEQQSGIANTA